MVRVASYRTPLSLSSSRSHRTSERTTHARKNNGAGARVVAKNPSSSLDTITRLATRQRSSAHVNPFKAVRARAHLYMAASRKKGASPCRELHLLCIFYLYARFPFSPFPPPLLSLSFFFRYPHDIFASTLIRFPVRSFVRIDSIPRFSRLDCIELRITSSQRGCRRGKSREETRSSAKVARQLGTNFL